MNQSSSQSPSPYNLSLFTHIQSKWLLCLLLLLLLLLPPFCLSISAGADCDGDVSEGEERGGGEESGGRVPNGAGGGGHGCGSIGGVFGFRFGGMG